MVQIQLSYNPTLAFRPQSLILSQSTKLSEHLSTHSDTGNVEVKDMARASLVAQWLRICLLMQGTRVRALVWEDPTCHGAAGPVSHNC